MDDEQVELLKRAIKAGPVYWISDGRAYEVRRVAGHIEEGKDEDGIPIACGLLRGGGYLALYNCQLDDFYSVTRLSETTAGPTP